MIGWGLQSTVPLPAGEWLVPHGEARPTGQALLAPNIECELPRGRKHGGLRNWSEMVGTGHDSWRTNTRGFGGVALKAVIYFLRPEGLLPRGVWI